MERQAEMEVQMRSRLRGLLTMAVAALGLLLALGSPTSAGATTNEASPIELVGTEKLSDRLTELTLRTAAISHDTGIRVLLPNGYAEHRKRRYPVLYLLHGSGGSETDWTTTGDAEAITANYPVIVVMPDTDQNGYYSDWYNDGAFGPPKYETYEISQLIPWIDARYRTIAKRRGRAVAGLSMGGFGALSFATRHPDLFVHVAGFSPAANTNYAPFVALQETGSSEGEPTTGIWGERTSQEVRWRAHNPWDLASNLRGMDVTLRYGNGSPGGPFGGGDPLEAGVHQMSVDLDKRLTTLGIPHINDDYGAGGHTWDYWQRDLKEEMPLLMKSFADPPKPESVNFRAVEPKYEIFGWHVAMHRKALEFSVLQNATREHFGLSGSGDAVVKTPPRYAPRKRFVVEVRTESADPKLERLRSSRRGRLRVEVPLGPANPDQAYTPEAQISGTDVFTTRVSIKRLVPVH
jgi:S-formylglutathione hydrolase FrmB